MQANNDKIVLQIKNNSPFPQGVDVFSRVFNQNTSLYSFDLSTENFVDVQNITIPIATINNPTPVLQTVVLQQNNIQGVVNALNSLNMGVFYAQGNTVYVDSNYYIYGNLSVNKSINPFISIWNTMNLNPDSTPGNQIKLPLIESGNYDFVVDWGDGTTDTITTWNAPETLHNYPPPGGTYTLKITGKIEGWTFVKGAGSGVQLADSSKLIKINKFGCLKILDSQKYFGITLGAFQWCINLNLSEVEDFLDISLATDISNLFSYCLNITTINNFNLWDFSKIKKADYFLYLSSLFNQDISFMNVSNLESGISFLVQAAPPSFTKENLDLVYNNWSLLPLQSNVAIDFGITKYTAAGAAGRAKLISDFNWSITDGGQV